MAYDDAGNLQNSISATLGAGPLNDLGSSTLYSSVGGIVTRYLSGSTNRLILTPAIGGTVINSLDASGCSDGFSVLISNTSTTFNITFTHNGGGTSTNQFYNCNAGSFNLFPLGAAAFVYVNGKWQY